MRVATKYVNLTRNFFSANGVTDYRIVESSGATEGAPAAGTAELIVDITTTGATLAANGLKVIEDGVILRSQANLVAARTADWSTAARAWARTVLDRIAAQTRARAFRESFAIIRRALLTLLACLAACGALIGGSLYLQETATENLARARTTRTALNQQLREAETEKREIADFHTKCEELQARGLFGEERRLEWVEAIRQIHEKRRLLAMTYSFAAQKSFAIDPSVSAGDIDLRGSLMTLRLEMLHEEDLLRFLQDLPPTAMQVVQKCKLARPDARPQGTLSPRLSAECAVWWITLADKSAPKPGGANDAK